MKEGAQSLTAPGALHGKAHDEDEGEWKDPDLTGAGELTAQRNVRQLSLVLNVTD